MATINASASPFYEDPEYRKRAQELGKRGYANRLCVTGEIERAKEYCALHNLGWPPFPAKGLPPMKVPPPVTTDPVELERTKLLQQKAAIERHMAKRTGKRAGRKPKDPKNAGKYAGQNPAPKLREVNARLAELEKAQQAPPEPISATIPAPLDQTVVSVYEGSKSEGAPPDGAVLIESPLGVAHTLTGDEICDNPTTIRVAGGPKVREAEIMFACRNPRLFGIRFLDGEKEEGTLWREPGRKVGSTVKVVLESGAGGANPIYKEITDEELERAG